jgi:hypothetical protein
VLRLAADAADRIDDRGDLRLPSTRPASVTNPFALV